MTCNSNHTRSSNRPNRNGLIGRGGSLLRTTGTGVILPQHGRLIGRDEPILLPGTEITLPEARSVAPTTTKFLTEAAAIVKAAADNPTGHTLVSGTGAAAI